MPPKKGGKGGKDALFEAVDDGDIGAVTAALEADADSLSRKNKDGWTLLHAAAFAGELDIVELLLARSGGALKDVVCKDGDSAAHYASAQGHIPVLEALVKAGAKLSISDKDGETPLDVAQDKKTKKWLEAALARAEEEPAGDGDADDGEDDDDEELSALGAGAVAGGAGRKSKGARR